MTTELDKRLADLSPAKLELLRARLAKTEVKATPRPRVPAEPPPITADLEKRGEPFPLTEIQEAYWAGRSGLFDLGTGGANSYMEYELISAGGAFVDRLEWAFQEFIDRHDMMRAVVLPDGRQQVLAEVAPFQITRVDLRGQSAEGVEAALRRTRDRLCWEPAPVDRWPLFEVVAQFLDGDRLRLHLRFDALLKDGRARSILLEELPQLFTNPETALPAAEVNYRDWAVARPDFEKSEAFLASRDYWLKRFEDVPPPPEIPLAVDLGPRTPSRFQLHSVELLPAVTWQRLKERAAGMGLTPSSAVMAAYIETLAAWSESPRFTLGLIGSYRPAVHPAIESVFGNFNTTYLFPVRERAGTFAERTRALQDQITEDLEYRHFTGLQLIRELNNRAGGTSRALAPVCFNSVVRNSRSEPEVRDEAWTAEAVGPESTAATEDLAESVAQAAVNPAGAATHAGAPDLAEADLEREMGVADAETAELAGPPPPAVPAAQSILARGMVEMEGSVNVPQILILPTLLEDNDGRLVCKWQVVEEAFPPGLLDAFLAGYVRLLEQLAASEVAWSQTGFDLAPEAPAPEGETVPAETENAGLAALLSAARPDGLALIAGDKVLTYGELAAAADRLAAALQALGAGPGTPVAAVLPAGRDQAVGYLAALRAGAPLLALDPALPPGDLQRVCRHCGVAAALTTAALDTRDGWPDGLHRLRVDQPAAEGGARREVSGPGTLLLADFEDGGDLRVSEIDGDTFAAVCREMANRMNLAPGDRLLSLAAPGTGLALFELLAPLLAGAAVVRPEPGAERSPAHWTDLLARQRVTVWCSPSGLAERLAAHLEMRSGGPQLALRLALLGGDPLDVIPLGLPARLRALVPGIEVLAGGGFPEGSVWSAAGPAGELDGAAARFPWGQPLGGQELHVLDAELRRRPDWVPGELFLGGAGLARGYFRDEAATACAFVTVPAGARLFRTGILARRLPDGAVEPLGRPGEHRVEANGRRIEPRRVEAALERHPAVRAAAVLPRQDGDGRIRLSAFVAAPEEILPEIAEEAARRLPDHLIPEPLAAVTEMPLTPSGRIDRAALEARVDPVPKPAPRPPRTALESEIANLWRDILGAAPESVTDNFFELGGNSFLATRLMAALGQRFRDLPRALPAFLENPTVEHLARLVEKARAEQARERSKLSLFQQMKLWRSERKRLDAAWEANMAPGGMRAFVILWIGQLVSGFGTGLGAFSLGVWTFDQNFSATQYAMVGLAAMLTGMLMTPVAGSVADRFDRRKVILFGDSCAACMTLLMALLLYLHQLKVWHVYPIAMLMTGFSALQGPALAVSISALVPRRQLVRASAMSQLIGTVTGMATPLLAGALVPKIGYHGVILIDFCTFLVGAATLLSIRFPASAQPVRQPGEKRSVLGDLAFGWSYLRLRPGLLSLLVLFALTNFSAGIVQSLLLPLIRSFASTAELGTVQSSAAFGALLGSVALSVWGGPPPGWRVWGIFVCMIVQGSLLFLGGVQPSVPLVACALFLAMLTGPIVGGSSQAIWMTKIGLDVQGRIFGIRGLIGSSTIPLAYLLAGPLADRVFGPLLMPGGALAGSVGSVIGVGQGRGIGLLFVVLGLFINLVVVLSFLNPRLRKVEEELPDVVRTLGGGGGAPPSAPAAAGAEGRAA